MNDLTVDLHRAFATRLGPHPSRLARLRLIMLSSEIHCVACHRFGCYARDLRRRHRVRGTLAVLTHRIWDRWVTHIDGAHISRDAQIGPGFLVMHQMGLFIGEGTIGAYCTVHQNVTIGQGVASGDATVPVLGDGVWIGPGAIVTGAIIVGDDVTISAGAVLSRDVADRCLVAGNPARVIARDYDNSAMVGSLAARPR